MQTTVSAVTSLSAGVDYISVTAKLPELREVLWAEAEKLMMDEEFAGNKRSPMSWKGMDGWKCGAITIMEKRGQYAVCQLRGSLAAAQWRRMHKAAENVTRFDIQVTVELEYSDVELGDRVYYAIKIGGSNLTDKRKYSIIANTTGGTTVYVGARQSMQFGRLYDKSAEQGQRAGKRWRYEVELKKTAAKRAADSLAELRENEPAYIAGTVYRWFDTRGVLPVFNAETSHITMEISRKPTDVEKQLEWLRVQVGPVIRRLVDDGRRESLEEVLGVEIGEFVWKQFPLSLFESNERKSNDGNIQNDDTRHRT